MASASLSESNAYLSASRQPAIWAAVATTYSLAVFFVGLRLFAKRFVRFSYWFDDWLLIAALVSLTCLVGDSAYGIKYGIGKHYELFGPGLYKHFFTSLFISWIFYTTTICLVKFSILALYWRIFQFSSIRIPILLLTGIVSCWGIATITTTIFQCHPISAYWNRTDYQGPCKFNMLPFFACISTVNIITDIAILLLPIPYVLTLQKNGTQKATTCAVFLSGSLVCVISIIRMAYLIRENITSPDVTWNYSDVAIWTVPECAVAIISSCLPSLRPIVRLLAGQSAQMTSTLQISKPINTTSSCLPNWDSAHDLTRNPPQQENMGNSSNQGREPIPHLPSHGSQSEPEDLYSVMGYSAYSIVGYSSNSVMGNSANSETQLWHGNRTSPKLPHPGQLVKELSQVKTIVRQPSWYDSSSDSSSLPGEEQGEYDLGQARKKTSNFYSV